MIRLDELAPDEDITCPAGANCVFTSAPIDARGLLDDFLGQVNYIPQPDISSSLVEPIKPEDEEEGDRGDDRSFKDGTGCGQSTRADIYALLTLHHPEWITQIRTWARDHDEGSFPMSDLPSDERLAFRQLLNDTLCEAEGACFPAVVQDIVDVERLRDSSSGRGCEVSDGVSLTPILDFSPNIDSEFSIDKREFWIAAAGQVNAGVVAQLEAGATLTCTVDFIRLIERKLDRTLRVKIPIITVGGADIVYAYFEPVLEAHLEILASIGRVRFQHIRHQAFAGIFGYSKTAYPNRTPAIDDGFNARVVRLEPQDWDGGNDGLTNSLDLELSEHISASAGFRAGLRVGLFGGIEIKKKVFGININLVKAGVSAYGQIYGAITGSFRLGDADPTSADCHWHGRVDASIEALAGYRVELKLLGIQVLNLHGETNPWVIWEPADQDGDGHSDPLWEDTWPSRFCPGHAAPFLGFDPCFGPAGQPTYQCESACNTQELDQACGIVVDCVQPAGYCNPATSFPQVSSYCGSTPDGLGNNAVVWAYESCNATTCLWEDGDTSVHPCMEGDPPQCYYDDDTGEATCCTFDSTAPHCFI